MYARTYYNITRTLVLAKVGKTLAALAVLLLLSCSKNEVINEVEEIHTNEIDPMNFTCIMQDNEQEHTTRAAGTSQPLTTGFLVSTFKAYDQSSPVTVMDGYNVEYKTTGTAWDGNVRPYWDYTQVSGQYEKYWDTSSYPYRFHAVAPYPANRSDITLTDKTLTINSAYYMQTCLNGMVTPSAQEAEPFLAAQLQRDNNGRDYDYLATDADPSTHRKEVNTTSQTRNRYVAMPFHHLNSKVRFGIYCTSPWTTANPLYIEGLTIKVASSNFVTQASGYSATGSSTTGNSWYKGIENSYFIGPTTVSNNPTLLRFDGGKELADNDLSHHQGKSSAYWLQCQGGLMQIPQENVELMVSMKLKRIDNGTTIVKEFNNVPIRMEDGTYKYNWRSGYVQTYYLIIGDIEGNLEITFTATLEPWQDVTGTLTTDLEK